MSKMIECSQGKHTIVDDEDYEWLSQYKWWAQASGSRKTWYAYSRMGSYKNKAVAMHRVLLNMKPSDQRQVDHINSDGLDNRRTNLRICEQWQNHANSGLRKNNTSGFKCIEATKSGKWQARITANGRRISLGTYSDRAEAAAAYDVASEKLHGKYSKTNAKMELFE